METGRQWYVMRYLYNHRGDTPQRLDQLGIRSYTPMRIELKRKGGRLQKSEVPVLRDLLFVRATREELHPLLAANSHFQHRYLRGGAPGSVMIVPDEEMESFIQAVRESKNPIYLSPEEVDLTRGTRIRLLDGVFRGHEGVLLKVKGARSKRLIVQIREMLAVAIEVSPEIIEVIQE